MFGLLPHLFHQPRALDDVGEAGVVLDVGGDGHLTARLQPGDEDGLQIGARRIDRRSIAGGSRADDQDLAVMTLGHSGDPGFNDLQIISFFGGAAGGRALKAEHVVEAERTVAANQPVIAKEPAGGVANHHIGAFSCAGARRRVKHSMVVPEART